MTDYFAKKVAKHVLKESATNNFGTEDPYFDYVSPLDLNGNPTGKPKKQKKATPPGLTKIEEKVLRKVTRRAYRLDNCLNVCGIRIGWGVVAGVIPGLGDIFDTLCALMVYRTCLAVELPKGLKSRMMLNIAIDFGIGLIPLLGDVADALYRANTRNAALLYTHLKARGAARIAEDDKIATRGVTQGRDRSHSRGRGVGLQKKQQQLQSPTQPKPRHDDERMQLPVSSPSAPTPQHISSRSDKRRERRGERSPPSALQSPQAQRRFVTAEDLAQPEPARLRGNNGASSSRGGWLSRLLGGSESGQVRERDVENLDDIPMRERT
ncbi:MAG: hypothetical protein LQ340_001022 [Diploschistes diacapsis]|nr:MAG: hypothetical protein LQ340_001022 [Diploschistes diacapsis]